jgi:hypothetical protein
MPEEITCHCPKNSYVTVIDDKDNIYETIPPWHEDFTWEKTSIFWIIFGFAIWWIISVILGTTLDCRDKYSEHINLLSDDDYVRVNSQLKEYSQFKENEMKSLINASKTDG